MKTSRILFLALSASLAFATARGTTVIPPSFDELVAQAEVIFEGTVTDVQSQWTGEGGQRHIVTYVTFKVEDPIKGEVGTTYTMNMLGGTVDGTTMEVTDSPKFKVGEREILFLEHNGTQFIPLVGIMHGRFHVTQDSERGTDVVTKNNGRAVTDVARLGKEDDTDEPVAKKGANTEAALPQTLDADSFKSAVRTKLAERR